MRYYAVLLDLRGRSCVVVGGGGVAERKVDGLREAGASITVVAPALTPGLRARVAAGEVAHVGRGYHAGDLAGAHLAMAATDDVVVNAAIAEEARRRGVWLNAADDPPRCDFILPAVLRRGPLTVAVSSGGESPALARVVRDWLEAELPHSLGEVAQAAATVRRELRAARRSPGADAWRSVLEAEVRERLLGALVAAP